MDNDWKSQLIKHLENKWSSQKCPMCGHSGWNLPSEIYEIREFQDGNFVIGGTPIVPVLPVTCGNCGNTVLVNAIVAGVTKREEGGDHA